MLCYIIVYNIRERERGERESRMESTEYPMCIHVLLDIIISQYIMFYHIILFYVILYNTNVYNSQRAGWSPTDTRCAST
jgi:hypothetical protein